MTAGVATADPVVALAGGSDYRSLYYAWEQRQWEAGAIELVADAAAWSELPRSLRTRLERAVEWRQLRAETATQALVRFVDAAPNEEQQVFLTTQLVDEARQLVFFDRMRGEVMHVQGASIEARRPDPPQAAATKLVLEDLPATAATLATPASDLGALARSIVLYEVVIVGVLGLVEQRALMERLNKLGALPGLREGLALTARDAERHVAFGLIFLAEAVLVEARNMAHIAAALSDALPHAFSALTAADQSPSTRNGPGDLVGSARAALDRWFAAVELKLPVVL
ncbi:MAG: hypothetical protein M3N53_12275 [Actinomycetota bacterium]|nr:hypothetical protein [Actinomycetota bacterium]